MHISEFKEQYTQKSLELVSGGIEGISNFLKHKTRDAKQFRDELTAIYSFVCHTGIADSDNIEIGGEAESFDAQIGSTILEVVRALPNESHDVRRQAADGFLPENYYSSPVEYSAKRLADLVFGALAKKQCKHYSDKRTLLISVDGEDTQEDDAIVNSAIALIRETARMKPFTAIWLVESGRKKAFRVFPADA